MTHAVILAGGKGSRLGGCDKPLLPLGQGTVLEALLKRLQPQVSKTALAIRGDQTAYDFCSVPLLRDEVADCGPLSGIISALAWGHGEGASSVLTLPGDTPFIPEDLLHRLSPGPSFAMSLGRTHPLVALWPTNCLPLLRGHVQAALASGDRRQLVVRCFAARLGMRPVSFSDEGGDPFFNVNYPADVEALAARGS
ncbi:MULTISPECIES: molybdenum cofactor guanylyltransferase [Asaia]|uniref:molybdenum cofactor guanylyltransferase n=1 Tax=Asaia TaxID=91914 RepID=UPI002FC388F7